MKKWNELRYDEKLACMSLYPDEALKDEHSAIRLEAYRKFGFTEEALKCFLGKPSHPVRTIPKHISDLMLPKDEGLCRIETGYDCKIKGELR